MSSLCVVTFSYVHSILQREQNLFYTTHHRTQVTVIITTLPPEPIALNGYNWPVVCLLRCGYYELMTYIHPSVVRT